MVVVVVVDGTDGGGFKLSKSGSSGTLVSSRTFAMSIAAGSAASFSDVPFFLFVASSLFLSSFEVVSLLASSFFLLSSIFFVRSSSSKSSSSDSSP